MSNPHVSFPAGFVPGTAIAYTNADGTPQLVSATSPLPVTGGGGGGGGGGAVTSVDGGIVAIGTTTDAAATSDAGSFGLIALTKRLLGKVAVGQKPMAQSLAVTLASDQSAVPVSFSGTSNVAATQLPASLGQKAMASSLAIAIASDQTNLEPGGAAVTGTAMPTGGLGLTGWLSAIYKSCTAATPAGTAHIGGVSVDDVADAAVTSASVTSATTMVSVPTAGFAGGAFHITSAGSATIVYEQSNDNVTWAALPVALLSTIGSPPVITTVSVAGIYGFTSQAAFVRARVSAYTSGTVTIALSQKRATPPIAGVSLSASSSAIGGVTVSSLPATPAGTNAIGNTNVATGYTDSTTVLAASATYSGTGRVTTSFAQYAFFNASAYADQAGTLFIEQSLDTGATYQPVTSVAVAAGTTGQLRVPLTGAFAAATLYRVRYVNGATANTVFRIASSFTAR